MNVCDPTRVCTHRHRYLSFISIYTCDVEMSGNQILKYNVCGTVFRNVRSLLIFPIRIQRVMQVSHEKHISAARKKVKHRRGLCL